MTQYSGEQRERLITAVAATSDANGFITIRVGPCPLGFVWQGSVLITNAPSGALFNASVALTPWGQWAGPTNFGPVQLWGNETLVVLGVGLERSTQYSMLFVGVALPEHLADALPPVAPMSVVTVETATVLVANALFTPNATTLVITPPTLTRRLTFVVDSTNLTANKTELDVVGDTSHAVYFAALLSPGASQNFPLHCSIEPAVDATYTISTSSGIGGTFRLWVLASQTNPMIDTIPTNPIQVEGSEAVAGRFPLNVGGSPVGPFKSTASPNLAVGNNQSVIAAPGAGNSIYLQTIQISNAALAAAAYSVCTFHDTPGNVITELIMNGSVNAENHIDFPGGFQMGNNQPLLVNIASNGARCTVTYVTGPIISP